MTAKDKAQQLIYAFEAFTDRDNELEFAKECALILAEDRLNELNFTHIGYGKEIMQGYQKTKVKYWNEVKNEIIKL